MALRRQPRGADALGSVHRALQERLWVFQQERTSHRSGAFLQQGGAGGAVRLEP